MNDMFTCGDQQALIGYLYGECDARERETIAAHLSQCAACAEEVAALQSTRTILSAWTPPDAALGFQVTRAAAGARSAEAEGARVLRPAAWWRQPLPAWAQVAAAAGISAAGLAVGGRDLSPEAIATPQAPVTARVAEASAPMPSVSREDLAQLEDRLRAMETAQARTAPARGAAARVDEAALLRQVEALVAERITASEDRQRHETILMIAEVGRDIDTQRQQLVRIGQMHGVVAKEVREQREALNLALPRVSFQQTSGRR